MACLLLLLTEPLCMRGGGAADKVQGGWSQKVEPVWAAAMAAPGNPTLPGLVSGSSSSQSKGSSVCFSTVTSQLGAVLASLRCSFQGPGIACRLGRTVTGADNM